MQTHCLQRRNYIDCRCQHRLGGLWCGMPASKQITLLGLGNVSAQRLRRRIRGRPDPQRHRARSAVTPRRRRGGTSGNK
eukprot:353670-Chlamydomonas_euryale.AAC.3